MESKLYFSGRGRMMFLLIVLMLGGFSLKAQTNFPVRLMSANLTSGNGQSYETAGIDIFQALKPDVVAIQEFRYQSSSTSNSLRTLINTAFGATYSFYCESFDPSVSYNIPNGIVSRWPILQAGTLDDPTVGDRGIAWARIDLPGTNDLWVFSVHLYGSGDATDRNSEAMVITNFIATNGLAGGFYYVGGDFNATSTNEASIVTFKSSMSLKPLPTDNQLANFMSNEPRNKPYDYVLPSFALTNYLVPTVVGTHTFPSGLIFDSQVWTNNANIAEVSPVNVGDSHVTGMQHMGVIRDFLMPGGTNSQLTAPSINTQPLSQIVSPGSNVTFSVTATGAAPLAYQWLFNGTNLSDTTNNSFSLASVQLTNAGNYSVIITNSFGSATSSIAVLTVSNLAPNISNPQNLTISIGQSATFSVTAGGTAPFGYQWQFNGANINGAMTNPFTLGNAQLTNTGAYRVVVTNIAGSVTSSAASLNVISPTGNATNLVVSQIYGGGGNASATYKNDFVELFNPTTNAIGISGWSIQYAATAGTSWQTVNLSGTIQPYHYYLIQLASSGTPGSALPAVDATGGINISAANGKVALVNSATALSGANPAGTSTVIDFVGYGTANGFEGTAAAPGAPASNNTTSVLRKNAGFIDANDNISDFTTLSPPSARNSSVTNPPVAPVPAIAPSLSSLGFSANLFSFSVSGTAGSNYIIQASTDISGSNWVSVQTNVAPFNFIQSNGTAVPQQFYRAIAP